MRYNPCVLLLQDSQPTTNKLRHRGLEKSGRLKEESRMKTQCDYF